MRQYLGLVMLGLGLGYAGYAHYPIAADREQNLAAVTRIIAQSTTVDGKTAIGADQPGYRQPLPTYAPAASPATAAHTPSLNQSVVAKSEPGPSALAPVGDWRATVAALPEPAPAHGAAQAAAARRDLVLNLQRELKRTGCYRGAIDGTWRSSSKRAMARFIDRVNASLPVKDPDEILLTLVRGHRDGVCGNGCPGGQILAEGRCTPKAILAQAAKPKAPVLAPQPPKPTKKVEVEVEVAVAALEPVKPVAPAELAPTPAPSAQAQPASEPLPGRMSVGGPANAAGLTAATSQPEILPWLNPAEPAGNVAPAPKPAVQIARVETEPASEHLARVEAARSERDNDSDAVSDPAAGSRNSIVNPLTPEKVVPAVRPRNPAVARHHQPRRTYRVSRQYYAFRPSPPRPAYRNRRYGARAVQVLFMHPLGRM